MTITDAQLQDRTTLETLAAACVKLDRGAATMSLLNPDDLEATALYSITSLTEAEMNDIQAFLPAVVGVCVGAAAQAHAQAIAETTPGIGTSPAMGNVAAANMAESSGTYTLTRPDDDSLAGTITPATANGEAAMDGIIAQINGFAVKLETAADDLVNG